jgi:hypothetical protein
MLPLFAVLVPHVLPACVCVYMNVGVLVCVHMLASGLCLLPWQ